GPGDGDLAAEPHPLLTAANTSSAIARSDGAFSTDRLASATPSSLCTRLRNWVAISESMPRSLVRLPGSTCAAGTLVIAATYSISLSSTDSALDAGASG